ncbi:MAG: hypothetical protein WAR37_00820 [Candidatus Microsaccharimonas sp.]
MKRMFHGVFSVFMLSVLSVLSLGIHAAAVQTMSMGHSMSGASHQTSSSSCFTACTTATIHKDEFLKDTNKDEDDKPRPPFYVQSQASSLLALKETHDQEARAAIEKEPPPETTPAYISLGVFRA